MYLESLSETFRKGTDGKPACDLTGVSSACRQRTSYISLGSKKKSHSFKGYLIIHHSREARILFSGPVFFPCPHKHENQEASTTRRQKEASWGWNTFPGFCIRKWLTTGAAPPSLHVRAQQSMCAQWHKGTSADAAMQPPPLIQICNLMRGANRLVTWLFLFSFY